MVRGPRVCDAVTGGTGRVCGVGARGEVHGDARVAGPVVVRVAVVTALAARGTDEDEPLLLDALAAAGARAQVVAWDDAGVGWSGFDLAVLRSTWDYAQRHEEFLAWCRRAGGVTRLVNPAPVVAWNADKTYLRDLAGAGVPVVETTWVAPGQDVVLPPGEVVVKPSVSAGSRDTARYGVEEHAGALAHVAALGAAGAGAPRAGGHHGGHRAGPPRRGGARRSTTWPPTGWRDGADGADALARAAGLHVVGAEVSAGSGCARHDRSLR